MKKSDLLFLLVVFLLASCSNEFDGKNGIKTICFPESEIPQVVVEYRDGKMNGELREYYRNGHLKLRQYYVDDRATDSSFLYHENGSIAEIQYKKDFKKSGTWKKFNKDGKLYEEISFDNDYLEGVSSKYTYRTGKLLRRLNYKSGMKEGKQEFYYNNGRPKAVVYYHYNKPAKGTEEWQEDGKKIANDFKISVREQNKLLLENRLLYYIKLENPQPDDEVYVMANEEEENLATTVYSLGKVNDEFLLEYKVAPGGFIMETVKIGAFRKTAMGNTLIRTQSINVSANNF